MTEPTEIDFLPYNAPFLIASGLSATATAVMLVTALAKKFYKEPLGLMIIAVNLTDFIYCFTKITATFYHPTSNIGCNIIEAITHFGLMSAAICGALFGHALCQVIIHQGLQILLQCIRIYFTAAILPSFIVSIILVLRNYVRYSSSKDTCVHVIYPGEFDYDYAIFTTLPLILACVLSVMWYIRASQRLRYFVDRRNIKNLYLLMIYPGIVLVCWMPTLTKNTMISLGGTVPFVVSRIAIVLSQLQGFLDAIVYGGQSIKLKCRKSRRPAMRESGQEPKTDLSLSALDESCMMRDSMMSQRVQVHFSKTAGSLGSDYDLIESETNFEDLKKI